MSKPVSGKPLQFFDIGVQFKEVVGTLKEAQISIGGLFVNAMQLLTLESPETNAR